VRTGEYTRPDLHVYKSPTHKPPQEKPEINARMWRVLPMNRQPSYVLRPQLSSFVARHKRDKLRIHRHMCEAHCLSAPQLFSFFFFLFSPGTQSFEAQLWLPSQLYGRLVPCRLAEASRPSWGALNSGAKTLVIKLSVFSSVVPLSFIPTLQCPGLSFRRMAERQNTKTTAMLSFTCPSSSAHTVVNHIALS